MFCSVNRHETVDTTEHKRLTKKDLKAEIRKVVKMESLRNIREGLAACLELCDILLSEGVN